MTKKQTPKKKKAAKPRAKKVDNEPPTPGPPVTHIKNLVPDKENARKHNERNIGSIADALHAVGAARSIVIDEDNNILAGNGTVEAAAQVGITNVRVIDATGNELIAVRRIGLNRDQKRRLALSDNRSAELAEWDADQIHALATAGYDFVKDGIFSKSELTKILQSAEAYAAQQAAKNPDKVPEPRKTKIKQGDMFKLGDHRLLCGDSTNHATLRRVCGDVKPQLAVFSPPYWVGKEYEKETTLQEVRNFIQGIANAVTAVMVKDGGRIVLNVSTASAKAINPKADTETLFSLAWWQEAFRETGWLMRHCRLWVKRGQLAAGSVAASTDVVDQHWETIAEFLPTFYYPEGLRRGQEKIGLKWTQQGVWDDLHGAANMALHGAAFPVELPSRYIQLYTKDGEAVLEPFIGTGTTMIASEMHGRPCYGVEFDPSYCQVAIDRWEEYTGKKAEKMF